MQMETVVIPGLDFEGTEPQTTAVFPAYPVQGIPVQNPSVQAPTPSSYSAGPAFGEPLSTGALQNIQNFNFEASDERSRFIRRMKNLLREKIDTWSYWQFHNPNRIPVQGVKSLLFPYGDVTEPEVLAFWSTPSQESCAYLITSQISLGFSTSYSLIIPSLKRNLIPMVLAEVFDPTVTREREHIIETPELGPLSTYGDIYISVRLGSEKLLIGFTMTTSSHSVVFGESSCSAFGMMFCPIKRQIVTASGEALSTIKLQTQWLQGP